MTYGDAMNIKAFKYRFHKVDDCHTIKRDLCQKCYKEFLDNITLKK